MVTKVVLKYMKLKLLAMFYETVKVIFATGCQESADTHPLHARKAPRRHTARTHAGNPPQIPSSDSEGQACAVQDREKRVNATDAEACVRVLICWRNSFFMFRRLFVDPLSKIEANNLLRNGQHDELVDGDSLLVSEMSGFFSRCAREAQGKGAGTALISHNRGLGFHDQWSGEDRQ